jgi:hypothetical protein
MMMALIVSALRMPLARVVRWNAFSIVAELVQVASLIGYAHCPYPVARVFDLLVSTGYLLLVSLVASIRSEPYSGLQYKSQRLSAIFRIDGRDAASALTILPFLNKVAFHLLDVLSECVH